MLLHFPDAARTAIAFAIVLGVLVFVHELGHYLAARWRGVHVETFAIGFGHPLARWTDRRGTVWKLGWLPLGGFVKLHGQGLAGGTEATASDGPLLAGRTFHDKPVLSRAIVVAAGPVANFLLAIVLFAALCATAGRPVALPVVGEVTPNSAAARGGLAPGDRILAINGTEISRFQDIQRIVQARPDTVLALSVQRDGKEIPLAVTTGSREQNGSRIGLLGITGGAAILARGPPPAARGAGAEETWQIARDTAVSLWQMLRGQRGADDLGGPLRIAELSGQVARLGVSSLVSFIALLSVNLGLINLFPVPVLDGGHLLFYLAEVLLGRPIPARAQEIGLRAGFAVLVGVFVFATWNDLSHFGLFRWIAGLIG